MIQVAYGGGDNPSFGIGTTDEGDSRQDAGSLRVHCFEEQPGNRVRLWSGGFRLDNTLD